MWFLIKGTFWFSLVLVLLPVFDRDTSTRLQNGPDVQFSDAFSAATGAYEYLSAICLQKPDVCEKGAETFTALGHRAREGARIAYQFLDKRFADETTAAPVAEQTTQASRASTPAATASDDVVTGAVVPVPKKKPAL